MLLTLLSLEIVHVLGNSNNDWLKMLCIDLSFMYECYIVCFVFVSMYQISMSTNCLESILTNSLQHVRCTRFGLMHWKSWIVVENKAYGSLNG